MNPSVNDRMNSVLRALETVVLPALPAEASLAQEQVMLAMGQIQIIQAQLDATPAYEAEELDDISRMGEALLEIDGDSTGAQSAKSDLKNALAATDGLSRERAEAIREAIDKLLQAAQGNESYHQALSAVILPMARERAAKDRQWFAAMGFDIELSAA